VGWHFVGIGKTALPIFPIFHILGGFGGIGVPTAGCQAVSNSDPELLKLLKSRKLFVEIPKIVEIPIQKFSEIPIPPNPTF
jgi:hypothetical protein